MNDPHVEALIYVVEHDSTVSYENATPIEFEHPEFRVRVEDGHARLIHRYMTGNATPARSPRFVPNNSSCDAANPSTVVGLADDY